jgi:hypothetical protein
MAMIPALLLLVGSLTVSSDGPTAAPADLAAYERASRGVGRDADAHVRLALWCEAHGLSAERVKQLALAVLADPKNAKARGLMGLVAYRGQWKRPEAVAEKVKSDEALAARLAEYNARRARTPDTAEAQWALALWCERNGLDAEARAHFTAVTRLDPAREAAWKRLGCKKVGGRWVTEAQLAAEKEEAEAREKADRHWKPLLTKWRGWLGDKARRAAAEEALAGVTDPRAVPAVWEVFVAGGTSRHDRAVQILGQIDAPAASRALTILAVSGPSAEVRRLATETLRSRDPREFAGLLVALLRDPITYEIRPVAGPGSTGAIFVRGKQANLLRRYTAPPAPFVALAPNDTVFPDAYGLPEIYHPLGVGVGPIGTGYLRDLDSEMSVNKQLGDFIASHDPGAAGRQLGDQVAAVLNAGIAQERAQALDLMSHPKIGPNGRPMGVGQLKVPYAKIPIGQMVLASYATAANAQQQLESDVRSLEAQKVAIAESNDRVLAILKPLTGQDLGPDREAWSRWLTDLRGYALRTEESPQGAPTVTEDVPIALVPSPSIGVGIISTGPTYIPHHACFAGGTPVHTLTGPRPIETIRAGDRVLVQDTAKGSLAFEPVVAVYHNPPNQTLRVALGGEGVVATGIHRFWKAGRGWTMARDLKPGDTVRTLGGTAVVDSVEPVGEQPVFNLEVAGGHSFFVGGRGLLVHDNSLVEPVSRPFDAAPDPSAVATSH